MIDLLRHIAIRQRLLLIMALGIVGICLIMAISAANARNQYIDLQKRNTKFTVDAALRLVTTFQLRQARGELDEKTAKIAAIAAVKSLTHSNREYFYIYHTDNFMIMHPFLDTQQFPDHSSTLRQYASKRASFLREQMRLAAGLDKRRRTPAEILQAAYPETLSGFFDYYLEIYDNGTGSMVEIDSPTVASNAEFKIGYGNAFKPWGWLILSSVYLNDVEQAIWTSLKRLLPSVLLTITLLGISAWLIALSITRPIKRGMNKMKEMISNISNSEGVPTDGSDEITELSIGFNTLLAQIHQRDKKIQQNTIDLENSNKQLQQHKEKLEQTVAIRTEDLQNAKDMAVAATEAKSKYLSTMTHELRTPLTGVLGILELLEDTSLSSAQREYTDIIHHSGSQLLLIISDILNFEKLDADKVSLEYISFDLQRLCAQLLKPFIILSKNKPSLQFQLLYSQSCPTWFNGDPNRISQILNNLLSNAYKFSHQGIVKLKVEQLDNGEIKLAVIDNGIGLSETEINKLFTRFEQANTRINRQFGGTGLGLAISKKLAELMHGDIFVDSKHGQGSNFYIELPLQISQSGTSVKLKSAATLDKNTELCVLIAEDNKVNQLVIKGFCHKLGVLPTICNDGVEAIEQFQKQRFDLVLLDINMPRKDGFTTAAEIRKFEQNKPCPAIPIFALTADSDEANQQRYLQVGIDGHLEKPINISVLTELLAQIQQQKSTPE